MTLMIGNRKIKNQNKPLEITYSELLSFSQNNNLLSGQKYKIIDFRTRHLIPNTAVYNEGSVEPLIVSAISNSQIHPESYSETYPQDIIYYELIQSHYWNNALINGADRGWIYYREDTLQNNKLTYDFRNVKWRRWVHPTYVGYGSTPLYLNVTDPGGGALHQDLLTFQDYTNTNDNDFSDQLSKTGGHNKTSYNNVFFYQCNHNICNGEMTNNTIYGNCHRNNFGISFSNNLVLGGWDSFYQYKTCGFYYNEFKDNFSSNLIQSNVFYGMKFDIDVYTNEFICNGAVGFSECDWTHIFSNTFTNHSLTFTDGMQNFELNYGDLMVLVGDNALIPRQKYKIINWQSPLETPDGDKNPNPEIEPLILTANTTNTFDHKVQSILYPQDEIYYTFDTNYIDYRRDTLNDIYGWFDWRNSYVRCYYNTVTGMYGLSDNEDPYYSNFDLNNYQIRRRVPINSKEVHIERIFTGSIPNVYINDFNVSKLIIGPQMDACFLNNGATDVFITSCSYFTAWNNIQRFNVQESCGGRFHFYSYGSVSSAVTLKNILNGLNMGGVLTNVSISGEYIGDNYNHSGESLWDGGIWSLPYSTILTQKTNNNLIHGQKYKINDFRTKHLIPNTISDNTGSIEPLIVTVISNNQIHPVAYSETYPQDIIYYELVQSHYWNNTIIDGGDRGWIYYREDTLQNNKLTYDFRNVKWRRWNTQSDGLGTWSVLTDNTFPHEDFYTFVDSTNCIDNDLSVEGFKIPTNKQGNYNNVFHTYTRQNRCGGAFNNNTFLGITRSNEFGQAFRNNILSDFLYNRILDNFSNNTTSGEFSSNYVSMDNYNNIYQGYTSSNIFNSGINGCTFPNGFNGNIIDTGANAVTFPAVISKMLDSSGLEYNLVASQRTALIAGIGISGSFTTVDSKTITVTNGIITSIV